MNAETLFDALGGTVGLAAFLIGCIALVEDHRTSPMGQRFTVGLMLVLCLNVAIDGFIAAEIPGRRVVPIGVAFALCLAVTWGYRLCALRRRRRAERQLEKTS